MEDEKQERIPNMYDTLQDLSRFMSGELDGVPGNICDPIQSVTLIMDKMFITTCRGLWRFTPGRDGNCEIVLISVF